MRHKLVFQRAFFFVLVVCLSVSLPVLGQRITGDIAGEVTDEAALRSDETIAVAQIFGETRCHRLSDGS